MKALIVLRRNWEIVEGKGVRHWQIKWKIPKGLLVTSLYQLH